MNDSMFWVNTSGMENMAIRYSDAAKRLDGITNRFRTILDPDRLANAAGNDSGGQKFLKGIRPQVDPMVQGFEQWRDAGDAAAQQILALRNGLDTVDDSTTNMAQSLHNGGDNQSGGPSDTNTGSHHH
jgi:hypothetical protein